jgi:hypothetical protein
LAPLAVSLLMASNVYCWNWMQMYRSKPCMRLPEVRLHELLRS